jgi:hypothetical protein
VPHSTLEARRNYHRRYCEEHSDKVKADKRKWYLEHKDEMRERSKAWAKTPAGRLNSIERSNRWRIKYAGHDKAKRRENRIKVISTYGGKCSCCSESEIAFLTIDHINGNGREDRKKYNDNLYGYLLKLTEPRKDLRVLCMNCNWAIRFGERCPHAT